VENLTNKQKVAIARQFNLIVRTINDFQIAHWAERELTEFEVLLRIEKEILFYVEKLLENSRNVFAEEPSGVVLEAEKFCSDFNRQLKSNRLNKIIESSAKALFLLQSILYPYSDIQQKKGVMNLSVA